MAELEEAEHADQGAARHWLARAASASTPDPTYVCAACGNESGEWRALCPACRSFDSLRWRTPGSGGVRRLAPLPGLAPALPLPARSHVDAPEAPGVRSAAPSGTPT
jgi:uncharacterized membrane-anchored protein